MICVYYAQQFDPNAKSYSYHLLLLIGAEMKNTVTFSCRYCHYVMFVNIYLSGTLSKSKEIVVNYEGIADI